jgi:hypothetical protein
LFRFKTLSIEKVNFEKEFTELCNDSTYNKFIEKKSNGKYWKERLKCNRNPNGRIAFVLNDKVMLKYFSVRLEMDHFKLKKDDIIDKMNAYIGTNGALIRRYLN